MTTRLRNEPVLVFTQVGVHADVEIELHLATADGESAWILFGRNEGLTVDFNDVDSLERLAAVAAEGRGCSRRGSTRTVRRLLGSGAARLAGSSGRGRPDELLTWSWCGRHHRPHGRLQRTR